MLVASEEGITDVVNVRDNDARGTVVVIETVLVIVRVCETGSPPVIEDGGAPPDDTGWAALPLSFSFSSSSSSSSGPSGESGESAPGGEGLSSGLSGLSGLGGPSSASAACLLNLRTLLGTYSEKLNGAGAGLRTLKESGMATIAN
jgi:hypothetical protein